MKTHLLLSFCACAAMASSWSFDAAAEDIWRYQPEKDRIGRIYYYDRTNTDGSMSVRVTVFRRTADQIDVYKESGLCLGAGVVSAELDLETFSAVKLTSSRLMPQAELRPLAEIAWDEETGVAHLNVSAPEFEIQEEMAVLSTPWHLYDFDFASLGVMTPHLSKPESAFSFGMGLVWPDFDAEEVFAWIGDVHADYDGQHQYDGVLTHRFTLSGSALEGDGHEQGQGALWLDVGEGHIVAAELPVPNHPGYADFQLRLMRFSDGGEAEWDALLKAHYENCEE